MTIFTSTIVSNDVILPISQSKVILKVHIPLLCDQVPHDWQLKLIDNPGFGDARQHVAQIASESLHTSSVYMYLLETGSIGGELAARFFIDLSNKDQGNYIMHSLN